jgi:hypothetical protein
MNVKRFAAGPWLLLASGALFSLVGAGCQSTVGGQTLPSAFYLRDDVQYFPPGPEMRLSRQVEALEEYRLRQQGVVEAAAPMPAAEGAP